MYVTYYVCCMMYDVCMYYNIIYYCTVGIIIIIAIARYYYIIMLYAMKHETMKRSCELTAAQINKYINYIY